MKKAILVVSFGTSYPETREKTIEACEKRVAHEFPDYTVFRAFTSNKIIKKTKNTRQYAYQYAKPSVESTKRIRL